MQMGEPGIVSWELITEETLATNKTPACPGGCLQRDPMQGEGLDSTGPATTILTISARSLLVLSQAAPVGPTSLTKTEAPKTGFQPGSPQMATTGALL